MTTRLLLACLLGLLPAHAELTATYTAGDQTHARTVRLPALSVEKGQTPTSGLTPGPFSVTWTSNLVLSARSRLYFSFEGSGKATLKVNGEEVLTAEGDLSTAKSDRLRLNAGESPIEITYTSNDDGSGRFRLFWEERSFPRESIPATAFTPSTPGPTADGRRLITEHQCTKCHAPDQPYGEGAMPELSNDSPDLTTIGRRVTESWLRQWIAQPHTLKPTTTMPAMVDASTPEGKQQAADLAAYLASLGAPDEQARAAFPPELVTKGGQIFHELACIACHTLPEVQQPDLEHGRVPLNNIAAKFQPGQLELFLKNPRAHYKAINMPDFQFSDEEASALTAYLTVSSQGHDTKPLELPDSGDITRGKALAKSMDCAACHTGPERRDASLAPPLASLKDKRDQGCLAPAPRAPGKAPLPNLSQDHHAALTSFLAEENNLSALHRDSPPEFAERQFTSQRCFACHDRDGQQSLLASLHTESKPLVAHIEGHDEKLDQSRPHHTHNGEMLKTTYIEDMLDGSVQERPRPWLEMRMPAFHHHADKFAEGLTRTHGIAPCGPDQTKRDPELAKTGQMIAGQTGLACIICHGVGDMKPLAAFEVQGIDLDLVHERLRPEYFHRWMPNPLRVTPDSKMPRYTQEDGSALRPDILEGDASRQFEALWHYLLAGPEMEKP
jgi:cytochrome c1